ncbi:LPS export ABC transporter permease LptF [Verticiella sediminum]|uniref:Lipopolysaccharide export system permease protein LptF n=1 Tax=Verticiella sediminum TaxID=1247510 RepID=A0A556A934_9BURK|nr:LPS export ABC transporter permease LptF [Verticiella sediminum]TSH89381.1 LPS export ABC transporter permease LptF [Verticiella sediminum]
MSLFQRSVVGELSSHAGVVFSTLVVVWLSVLLVRLLGDAAAGSIGADVVLGLAAFSTITALPTVITVAVFIAILTAVGRSYRESEMVVWFASGLSLASWVRPVLRFAVPAVVCVALLTLLVAPWAYRQIGEYRVRFEQRSDLSRVIVGQFGETSGGSRVFVAEAPEDPNDELGGVFVRELNEERGRISVVTSNGARVQVMDNGDRFLVLDQGQRYDVQPGSLETQLVHFERYGVRLERNDDTDAAAAARAEAESIVKARPTSLLLKDGDARAAGEMLWRLSLPLVVLNLALIALPLGAVNPRLGRSGDLLMAGLIAMLYLNVLNLLRSWVAAGNIPFVLGFIPLHVVVALFGLWLLRRKLVVRMPRKPRA